MGITFMKEEHGILSEQMCTETVFEHFPPQASCSWLCGSWKSVLVIEVDHSEKIGGNCSYYCSYVTRPRIYNIRGLILEVPKIWSLEICEKNKKTKKTRSSVTLGTKQKRKHIMFICVCLKNRLVCFFLHYCWVLKMSSHYCSFIRFFYF